MRRMKTNRSFGVEVELNGLSNEKYPEFMRELHDRDAKPNDWGLQPEDYSVAAEYVSPVFQRIEKFLGGVKNVYSISKKANLIGDSDDFILPVPFSVHNNFAGHHIHFGTLNGLDFSEAEKLARLIRPILPFAIWLNANSIYLLEGLHRISEGHKYRSYRLRNTIYATAREVIRQYGVSSENSSESDEHRHYDELNYSMEHNTLEFRSLDANIPQATTTTLALLLPVIENLDSLNPPNFSYRKYKNLRRQAMLKRIPPEFVKSFIPLYFESLGLDVNLKKLPLPTREVLALALTSEKTPFDVMLDATKFMSDLDTKRFIWRYFDIQTEDPLNYLSNLEKLGINLTLQLPEYLAEYLEIENDVESKLWHVKNAYYCSRGNYGLVDKLNNSKLVKELKGIIKRLKFSEDVLTLNEIKFKNKEIYLKVFHPNFSERLRLIKEEKESRQKHKGLYIKIGRIKSFNGEGFKGADIAKEISKLMKLIFDVNKAWDDVFYTDDRYYFVLDMDNKEPVGFLSFDRINGRILELGIRAKYRRKGIAKELIRLAVETSEKRPFVYIHKDNKKALRFFAKTGFKNVLQDENKYLYVCRLRKPYSWESLEGFENRVILDLERLQRAEIDELNRVLVRANREALEYINIKIVLGRVRTQTKKLTMRDLNNFIYEDCRVLYRGRKRRIDSLVCGSCGADLVRMRPHYDDYGFCSFTCRECRTGVAYLNGDRSSQLDRMLAYLRDRILHNGQTFTERQREREGSAEPAEWFRRHIEATTGDE